LSLRSIAFKEDYRSGRDDALKDFFLPAFKVACRYDRAVGYFSSSALECFAEPLGQFVQFGGTIRLVTSVELRDEDAAVIESGRSAAEVCEERVLEVIGREFGPGAVSTGVRKLGALLEAGRLEIKIATPVRGRGIYHEKVGIFHDEGEDYVAFSGSTNESREALLHNYECIDVYPSWEATSRARGKVAHFEALWAGVAPGARTYTFPEAAERKLIRAIKEAPLRGGAAGTGDDEGLWPHQQAAIAEFMDKRRGILEMATGTGKTRTALVILGRLIRSSAIQTAIIAADGNDLLDQWWGDVAGVVAESYPRFRLLRHYGAHHDRDEYLIDPENTVLLMASPFSSTRPIAAPTPGSAGCSRSARDVPARPGAGSTGATSSPTEKVSSQFCCPMPRTTDAGCSCAACGTPSAIVPTWRSPCAAGRTTSSASTSWRRWRGRQASQRSSPTTCSSTSQGGACSRTSSPASATT
jgi:hypothetical protein